MHCATFAAQSTEARGVPGSRFSVPGGTGNWQPVTIALAAIPRPAAVASEICVVSRRPHPPVAVDLGLLWGGRAAGAGRRWRPGRAGGRRGGGDAVRALDAHPAVLQPAAVVFPARGSPGAAAFVRVRSSARTPALFSGEIFGPRRPASGAAHRARSTDSVAILRDTSFCRQSRGCSSEAA